MRVLIIYDVDRRMPDGSLDGWAYFKRGASVASHAPDDVEASTCSVADVLSDPSKLTNGDAIFLLDYASCKLVRQAMQRAGVNVPLVVSFNSDRHRRHDLWTHVREYADAIVVNNRCRWDYEGRPERTYQISNGIDERWWYVEKPIAERADRVLWCGSSQKGKGYTEILSVAKPKLESLGFDCSFRPIDSIHADGYFGIDQQRQWYNSGAYYVCASESEGAPSASLEAMASGCCLVTTRVGNAMEMPKSPETCVFIDRSVEGLIGGLLLARERRVQIASAGAELMRTKWSYGGEGKRAAVFYWLFREIVAGRTPSQFAYDEEGPWRD